MTRTLITAALATAMLAAPATADQLARAVGVEPGVYSTAELSLIRKAQEENDDLLYRTIVERAETRGAEVLSTQSIGASAGAGAGQAQLAPSLGVEPGAHSFAELARLKTAAVENDHQRIALVTEGSSEALSTQSVGTSTGKAQLARSLGVDPGDHSAAQLVRMHIDAHD